MTDTSTEADEATTTTARPVRVPNVSPSAISGLGHHVIGSATTEVYDAEAGYADELEGLHIDLDDTDHVETYVRLAPEDRQDAVRAALTGDDTDPLELLVTEHATATGADPDDIRAALLTALNHSAVPEPADPPQPRVDGTQAAADPASPLTGDDAPVPQDSDPTNGALPTDTYTVSDYTVEQVNDYLDKAPAMVDQVLAAEADGQARVGILHGRHGTPKAD